MDKRLKEIVSLVPKCSTLADIGCDHGYIGRAVLVQKKADFVWFTDISYDSLMKAKKLNEDYQNVGFLCVDGITVDVEVGVIAGMGGVEIMSILKNASSLPHTLILQPMRNQRELREYLSGLYNLEIDKKIKCKDRFYDLIVAKKGQCWLNNMQLMFGKTNIECYNRDFFEFIQKEIVKTNKYLLKKPDNLSLNSYLNELHNVNKCVISRFGDVTENNQSENME